jgi:PAT family beta-lactamase induction signal transducer AmpG
MTDTAAPKKTLATRWSAIAALFKRRETLAMLGLGFASGLPLLLILSTLSVWLRQGGISRSDIGLLAFALLAYSLKPFWAPLVDRFQLPVLHRMFGQRRSWMLLAQCFIAFAIGAMALGNPQADVGHLAIFAVVLAFSSATLDIAVDAWRVESGSSVEQGALASATQIGYRIANLMAGAMALYMVEIFSHGADPHAEWPIVNTAWQYAYWAMAGLTLIGFAAILFAPEPASSLTRKPLRGISALIEPLSEFFTRERGSWPIVLAFIFIAQISLYAMGPMANPMYVDTGYTPAEIATATKVIGVIVTIVGTIAGGLAVARYGVASMLALAVASLSLPTVALAWVAISPHEFWRLATAIAFDNFANGFGGTVFIAYLTAYTNPAHAATQYALLAAWLQLPGRFIGPFTGMMIDRLEPQFGAAGANAVFFTGTALIGVPAILLAIWCAALLRKKEAATVAAAPASA